MNNNNPDLGTIGNFPIIYDTSDDAGLRPTTSLNYNDTEHVSDDDLDDNCNFDYSKNKICNCERLNEPIRIKCLARALYTFFKKRGLLHRYSRKEIESSVRVIDINFEDIYINSIQNITNRAAESIILLRFIDKFGARHPKFVTETRFVEFIKCADLFKEL